jgi:hypothetical protein
MGVLVIKAISSEWAKMSGDRVFGIEWIASNGVGLGEL